MDNSRDRDLRILHERMNNPLLSNSSRKVAWRSFNKIVAQTRDKELVELRHRLIKAHQNNDTHVISKLEMSIKERERWLARKYGERVG